MALNDLAVFVSDVGNGYALLWGMVSSVLFISSIANFISPIIVEFCSHVEFMCYKKNDA